MACKGNLFENNIMFYNEIKKNLSKICKLIFITKPHPIRNAAWSCSFNIPSTIFSFNIPLLID